jgi:PAS domain S-box-containing protein
MGQIGAPLLGSYDYRLVGLSIFIAILASYVALDLAARVGGAKGRARLAWLTGGAISMGSGIWSMHFVGMLAFKLPVPVRYNLPTVLLSLFAAVLASAVALYVVSRERFGHGEAIVGSLAMGGGIAAMHYIGMAAMRLPAMCHYSLLMLGLSVLIAMVASLAALTFAFDFSSERRGATWAKMTSAVVMGVAIASMHYTGMASAGFVTSDLPEYSSYAVSITQLGVASVVTVTLLILGFTLLTTLMGRQFAAQGLELQLTEERYRLLFEHCLAGVYRTTLDGRILDCNEAFARILGYNSRKECLGRNITENYVKPADREAFIGKIREKKTIACLEPSLRARDGRPVWVLKNATVIEGGHSVPPVIEGTLIDITDRKRAEEAQRDAHEGLEARVRERTAELAKANEALRSEIAEHALAEEELRRLSAQLLRLQDEERRRIARDLHDSTGQDLVALKLSLGQLRASLPSSSRKARELASECQALADQCVREVRTLSYVLHPPMLDEAGLEEAIRQYVEGFTQRSGTRVKLELSPRIGRMAQDVELALFRVVQESLTNIQRHSGSLQAKIRIDRHSDHLTLEISDRGQRFSGGAPGGNGKPQFKVGVGLPSMQERVRLIGGQLDIYSTIRGTIVRVTIPANGQQREEALHSNR